MDGPCAVRELMFPQSAMHCTFVESWVLFLSIKYHDVHAKA
jgi:hypothetical protein